MVCPARAIGAASAILALVLLVPPIAGQQAGSVDASLGVAQQSAPFAGKVMPAAAQDLALLSDPAITITAPNGGEGWAAGTVQNITWTWWDATSSSALVAINLLRGGNFYADIGFARLGDATFPWRVCDLLGDATSYTVRVACVGCSPPVADVSDAPFEITGSVPLPTLTLTSPAGGETWAANSTRYITWTSANPRGAVVAWLYKGGQRTQFLGQAPMTAGAIRWDIGHYAGNGSDFTVRLVGLETCGPSVEAVGASFTISGSWSPPALALVSPNGGEVWPADSVQTIRWNGSQRSGVVELWLTRAPARYEYLDTVPMVPARFDWRISPCIEDGNDCRIVARWLESGLVVEAVSAAPFSIVGSATPALSVTSPAGGAVWPAGTQQVVSWTSTSVNGEVAIELWDFAVFVLEMGHVPVSDGVFAWDICPGIGDGTYQMRVRMGACGVGASSGDFSVAGSATPTLTLTSPVGGTTWEAGAPHEITWTSTGLSGLLDIYLPNDALYQSGHATAPIVDGKFGWPIPPTLTWPLSTNSGSIDGVWIYAHDCGPLLSVYGGTFQITPRVAPLGDVDGDGDIDLADAGGFQFSFTGPGPVLLDPPGDFFDFVNDGDVDSADWDTLDQVFTGPGGYP